MLLYTATPWPTDLNLYKVGWDQRVDSWPQCCGFHDLHPKPPLTLRSQHDRLSSGFLRDALTLGFRTAVTEHQDLLFLAAAFIAESHYDCNQIILATSVVAL